jgi:hypothetical protein
MKPYKIFLAIVCIVIAIYNFDIYNLNGCIVAVLMFMQAILLISRNRKLNRILTNVSLFLAIFLILKLITTG